jgi:hypothetical protein
MKKKVFSPEEQRAADLRTVERARLIHGSSVPDRTHPTAPLTDEQRSVMNRHARKRREAQDRLIDRPRPEVKVEVAPAQTAMPKRFDVNNVVADNCEYCHEKLGKTFVAFIGGAGWADDTFNDAAHRAVPVCPSCVKRRKLRDGPEPHLQQEYSRQSGRWVKKAGDYLAMSIYARMIGFRLARGEQVNRKDAAKYRRDRGEDLTPREERDLRRLTVDETPEEKRVRGIAAKTLAQFRRSTRKPRKAKP